MAGTPANGEQSGVSFPVSADGRRSTSALGRAVVADALGSRAAAVCVARDGLTSLHRRMRVAGRDGGETGLDTLISAPARHLLTTVPVTGGGVAESELSVPYRG